MFAPYPRSSKRGPPTHAHHIDNKTAHTRTHTHTHIKPNPSLYRVCTVSCRLNKKRGNEGTACPYVPVSHPPRGQQGMSGWDPNHPTVSVLCTVTSMDLMYCTSLRRLNNGIPKDEAKDKNDNSLA